MFLKLLLVPQPDVDDALRALDAAREVCAEAGIAPVIAWRDSMTMQHWFSQKRPAEMVSDDEVRGALIWHTALAQARIALRLPSHVHMDIEVLAAPPGMRAPVMH